MNYVKPQKPLIQDGKGIYPLTTIDQVVRADGRRFSEKEFNRVFQRNLLRPTLQTTTTNGVTCTNNGDGTYTLNGTASSETYFVISNEGNIKKGTYKLVGCPSNGGVNKYMLYMHEINIYEQDYGDGVLCNIANDISLSGHAVNIRVSNGVTVNNLVF